MATWKEKGEVPDSDEDEELESLRSASPEYGRVGTPTIVRLDDTIGHDKNDGDLDGEPVVEAAEIQRGGERELTETRILNPERGPLAAPLKETTCPPASLESLGNLEFPPLWFENEYEDASSLTNNTSHLQSNLNEAPRFGDEVSKCYVRITPAASSPLSSPPRSLPGPLETIQSSGSHGIDSRKRKDLSDMGQVEIDIPVHLLEHSPAPKRHFRQRKGIQIHPYRLEDERYHRILRERGIRPTKIVHSQEKHRTPNARDADSQLLDYQNSESDDGFVATQESQTRDYSFDHESSPAKESQISAKSLDFGDMLADPEPMDSDDDLPDIAVLLRQPHKPPAAFSSKQYPKTYTAKAKRPPQGNTRIEQSSRPPSQRESSIFDVPASPPSTSSPFPVFGRRNISRTTSIASKESTPQRVDERRREPGDDPRPLNSAEGLAFIHIGSGSEKDDELKSADETPESFESSSDESLLLRRVGKRIRGVLPASHLRLDLQKKKEKEKSRRKAPHFSRSASPAGVSSRPGVALPTVRRNSQESPVSLRNGLGFLEELSTDEEDLPLSTNRSQAAESGVLLAQSSVGYAEEVNSIDAMLPSRKRLGNTLTSRPTKRTKPGLFDRGQQREPQRQPRITEHLDIQQVPRKASRTLGQNGVVSKRAKAVSSRQLKKRPSPPALSILDVTDTTIQSNVPLFIRVAARTTRMRKNHGRQSPTRKFIKLANREDTADAQSVLQEWKDCKIKPKDIMERNYTSRIAFLPALQECQNFQQTKLPSPAKKIRPLQSRPIRLPAIPRRLVITTNTQQSMNDFVSIQEPPATRNRQPQMQCEARQLSNRPEKRRVKVASVRPAQLETKETDTSSSVPLQHFLSSKKLMDVLYRSSRKRAVPSLPLHRFLTVDDVSQPESAVGSPKLDCELPVPTTESTSKPVQHRKRRPRRIDVGAAEYRQPENPLILDLLAPVVVQNAEGAATKLLGLGGYGTKYPIHFDILPLPPGVFFQGSTFIGSGRLAGALRNDSSHCSSPDPGRMPMSLSLSSKQFQWGSWNENVSSEVGICFDWIVDQYSVEPLAAASLPAVSSVDVLESVSKYIQDSVTFDESRTLQDFLSRMTGVLDDTFQRLHKEPPPADSQACYLRIMGRCALLCLQVLHLSRSAPEPSLSTTLALETLLRKVVGGCIEVLIAHGLEDIRELYDNLQYLSFRDRGISSDMFSVEAWVIVLKVLSAAQIPREGFMDVVNSVILSPEVKNTQDARVMEKAWYSMFSLLPLCDFDHFGVIIPGIRHEPAFESWSLPQQMLKRVFELYGSNQRQSPGFNDYCRSIVSRCHFLMVDWRWWNCRGIIGTLFDFFASHNLAHLRNEEVYTSPHFLQELHMDPSLAVEPEDRCFHIFLKVVALGIKHLVEVNNHKGIRNLVARLLPNHNRQYPKEEEIHQRDLASLRNHHDLLCTLFWTAPPPLRPSPALLQKLVNPAQAHSQASLINIRSWENLARFVLANSPSYQSYSPLFDWQRALLDALWQQYHNTEAEVRSQAELLSSSVLAPISEAQIMATVTANRTEAMNLINAGIQAINAAPFGKMSIAVAMKHFDMKILGRILDDEFVMEEVAGSAIQYLQYYIWILRNPLEKDVVGEDSQDSEVGRSIFDRHEALLKLWHILGPLQRHLQRIISKHPNQPVEFHLTDCWANLVSLLIEEHFTDLALPSFVGRGKYAVVNHHKLQTVTESDFWGEFLLAILRRSFEFVYSVRNFDIGSEWLKILALPPTVGRASFSVHLSSELYRHGYCLLSPQALPDLEHLQPTDGSAEALFRELGPAKTLTLALRAMKKTLKAETGYRPRPAQVAAMDLFKGQLKSLMSSMEANLRSMAADSYSADLRHDKYVEYVQEIVGDIHIYCSQIQPLSPFFRTASKYYWPSLSDPLMFIEHSKHLSLELAGDNPDGASNTLFYYLVLSFDEAVARDDLQMHTSNLQRVLRTQEHLKFVLKELITPMLETAFQIEAGWVLCCSYFPILAVVLSELFLDDEASEFAFQWATTTLDTVMYNLELYQDLFKDRSTGRLNSKLHDILAILFAFCNALRKGMIEHAAAMNAPRLHLASTHRFFEQMAINIKMLLNGITPPSKVSFPTELTPSMGTYYNTFAPQMKLHMDEKWTIDASGKYLILEKDKKKARLMDAPDLGKTLAICIKKGATPRFSGNGRRFLHNLPW